jgi:hypothetical protein
MNGGTGNKAPQRRMPLNYESLMASGVDDHPVSYTDRDAMLYALGVGFASRPEDT